MRQYRADKRSAAEERRRLADLAKTSTTKVSRQKRERRTKEPKKQVPEERLLNAIFGGERREG